MKRRLGPALLLAITAAAGAFAQVPGGGRPGAAETPDRAGRPQLVCFGERQGVAGGAVHHLARLDGGVLFLARHGGLERFDGWRSDGLELLPAEGPGGRVDGPAVEGSVRDLAATGDGRVWAALGRAGLVAFGRNGDVLERVEHDPDDLRSLRPAPVVSLAAGGGRLWIGTEAGLDVIDDDGLRHLILDPVRPGEVHITSLVADDDTLWIGTRGRGLWRLSPLSGDDAEPLPQASRLGLEDVGAITALAHGEHHEVFVGSEGGLFALHPRTLGARRVPLMAGVGAAPGVTALAFDGDGSLWIGTERGLFRRSLAAASLARTDARPAELVSRRAVHDLLPLAPAGGGRLLAATAAGLCHVLVGEPDRPPPPVIARAERLGPGDGDRPIAPSRLDDGLRWPADAGLALTFAAPDAPRPEGLRFRYRLDSDGEWVELPEGQPMAVFQRFAPGRHELSFEACRGDDCGSPSRLRLDAASPPWLSLPAYLLYALLSVAAVAWVVLAHRRTRRRQAGHLAKLREADRLKDEFVTTISQRLSEPLGAMTGATEQLLAGDSPSTTPAMAKNLEILLQNGRRLERLLERLQVHVQETRSIPSLQAARVQLYDLVDEASTLLLPLAADRGLELINLVPADLPAVVVDRESLYQALQELVGSAIEQLDDGVLEIRARSGTDAVELQLFSLARRTERAAELGEGGGDGDGASSLSIDLLRVQGVRVEQRPEEAGCLSTIRLPVVQGVGAPVDFREATSTESIFTGEPLPSFREPSSEFQAPGFRAAAEQDLDAAPPPRVLIVDDEDMVCQLLINLLSPEGYDAQAVRSGEKALQRLLDERQAFDLVLLDVKMPGMSGYETCRRLREVFSANDLPIIFLTGLRGSTLLMEGLASGGNDYLTKPISREELLARLELHFQLLHMHRFLSSLVERKSAQIEVLRQLAPVCVDCRAKARLPDGRWRALDEESGRAELICPTCRAEADDPDDHVAGGAS